MNEPVATALVSTWSSERFLRGCLDDLLQQTLGDRLEILVIDACSPEREGEIVRAYQSKHANIRYVRTPVRESTSASFNRGTAMARGRYLSTANTDDRHAPDFFATMVDVLEQHPEFGIAYADSAITRVANETWHDNTASTAFAWPDFTPAVALSCCLFGCQPVWRRACHDAVGPWDEAHPHANDQDMFLRVARRFGAVHVREVLGLFLQRPDSVAGSGNRDAALRDALAVFEKHRSTWALEEVFPALATDASPLARAAALFELGNLAALSPYTDCEFALACWQQAVALPLSASEVGAVRRAFANNAGCVLACAGSFASAARALRVSGDERVARRNAALVAAAAEIGRPPRLQDLGFVVLDHEVVRGSRRARGLRVDEAGSVTLTPVMEQVPWDVFVGPNGVPFPGRRGPATIPALACS